MKFGFWERLMGVGGLHDWCACAVWDRNGNKVITAIDI